MRTAGIRELKASLSAYLREVQLGETVLVTDRGRVIAELRPPAQGEQRGRVGLEASSRARQVEWSDWKPLGLPKGIAQDLIDAERAEGEEDDK
jgi:antitoxin (DNA-binding transcriptional repressor) of toxin-antitoxin stability system